MARLVSSVAAVLVAIAAMVVADSHSAWAEKRVALVIGNGAYVHAPTLVNPRNDAEDMSAALKTLNFKVLSGFDLDKTGMDRLIKDFAGALVGAEVGLFFFAGHGLQVSNQNYLMPIDAQLATAAALDFETVRLDLVQRAMENGATTNLLFLDACRNNPLSRNLARAMGTRSTQIGRGLAATEAGLGTLIGYATQPGNVALDGTGRNSPYTGALVRQLTTSTDDIMSLLVSVRNEVLEATQNRQVTWEHTALRAQLRFRSGGPDETAGMSIKRQPIPAPSVPSNQTTQPSPPAPAGSPPRKGRFTVEAE